MKTVTGDTCEVVLKFAFQSNFTPFITLVSEYIQRYYQSQQYPQRRGTMYLQANMIIACGYSRPWDFSHPGGACKKSRRTTINSVIDKHDFIVFTGQSLMISITFIVNPMKTIQSRRMLCLLKLSQTIGQTSIDKLIGSIGSIFLPKIIMRECTACGIGDQTSYLSRAHVLNYLIFLFRNWCRLRLSRLRNCESLQFSYSNYIITPRQYFSRCSVRTELFTTQPIRIIIPRS